jgi:hypothetical protein
MMRSEHTRLRCWITSLVAVALLAACGGGGGSTPSPTASAFNGTYSWHAWSGNVAGPVATAEWGSLTTDGFGAMGGMYHRNVGGVITGPLALTQLNAVLDATNMLSFDGAGALVGGLASDGSAALLAVAAPGNHPGIALLLRQAGDFEPSDLSGDYHLCGWSLVAGNDVALFSGSVTFDGAGNATALSFGVNNNGVVTAPAAPVPGGTYAPGTGGEVIWTTPSETLSGSVSVDGELVVFSGATGAIGGQELFVLIKKATTASNATFSGRYHDCALTALGPPSAFRYATSNRRSDADGAGTVTTVEGGQFNFDGALAPISGTNTSTYLIAADGAMTANGGGVSVLRGGISQSGRYVVLAGDSVAGRPLLQLLIR